jgi:hypothetical protein
MTARRPNMAEARDVVVNPLLRLRTSAVREGIRGGPKDVSKITPQLYAQRQANLLARLEYLKDAPQTAGATHDGRVLLWAGMDGDSQASTHTPNDLFNEDLGCQLVAAWLGSWNLPLSPTLRRPSSMAIRWPPSWSMVTSGAISSTCRSCTAVSASSRRCRRSAQARPISISNCSITLSERSASTQKRTSGTCRRTSTEPAMSSRSANWVMASPSWRATTTSLAQ